MKEKIKEKAQIIKNDPKVQKAVKSMKPDKTIWGFLGVVLFFIAPEIVAFIWGAEITSYAKDALITASVDTEYYYKALIMLFEDGGSWINLAIGFALLIWLFF